MCTAGLALAPVPGPRAADLTGCWPPNARYAPTAATTTNADTPAISILRLARPAGMPSVLKLPGSPLWPGPRLPRPSRAPGPRPPLPPRPPRPDRLGHRAGPRARKLDVGPAPPGIAPAVS